MVHKKKQFIKKTKLKGTTAYRIGNKLYIVPKFWKRTDYNQLITMVHKMKRIETKNWIIQETETGATILKKPTGKTTLLNYRGSIADEEDSHQPASIQVSKDFMKTIEESNTQIFFDASDLRKKKWQNKDLPKA